MVLLTFRVPRAWRDLLHEAASAQTISMADLGRMILRAWLRERYPAEDRAVLGAGNGSH